MTPDGPTSTDLSRLRQGLYRFVAAGLLPPDEERLAAFSAAIEIVRASPIHGFTFATSWHRLGTVLDAGVPVDDLQADYARLFESRAQAPSCPLVESAYLVLPRGPGVLLADLDREYHRLGLAADPHALLPVDHAVLQLEVMASLCAREAEATDRGEVGQAERVLGEEERFLVRHLARWFPDMARRGAAEAGGGFYEALLTAARAFVHHDRQLVSALAGQHATEAVS